MATWNVERAGNWNTLSDDPTSPWYDAGTQTALASLPAQGDTITNAGAFTLTFDVDFPSAASVLTSDTVNRVAGTFDEAARNTDPGEAAVRYGVTYTIQGVSKTGSAVYGTVFQHQVIERIDTINGSAV